MDKIVAAHINYSISNCDDLPNNIEDITLKDYQLTVCKAFLGLDNYNNLLLFWDTGYGKTITVIYIIKHIYNKVFPNWKIILFIKSSLRYDPWEMTIKKYINNLYNNIIFIHYDSENAQIQFLNCLKSINFKTERILVIIDEVHQFISRIISKQNTLERKSMKLYNKLLSINENRYNRIICLSATPIINKYTEFKYLIKLLRYNLDFDDNYIINDVLMGRNMFYELLSGVCSYQKINDNMALENLPAYNGFALKNIIYHDIKMSELQSMLYNKAEYADKKNKLGGLRTLRRLVSSFVFNELKIKEDMNEEQYITSIKKKLNNFKTITSKINFSKDFINYYIIKSEKNIKETKKIVDITEYTSKIIETIGNNIQDNNRFISDIENYNLLKSYSCKYIKTCNIILNSPGKCLIYQPFVSFEGVATLNTYLKVFNISYIEYSKNTLHNRDMLVKEFNKIDNINGDIIKACIFTTAGSEGISFNCINDIIIMDIPWSESIMKQIIGRALRLDSHNYIKDRNYVNIHILLAYTLNNKSIDVEILELIKKKYKNIKCINELLKDSSIEYLISKYPNEIVDKNENIFDIIKSKKIIPFSKNNIIINKYLKPIYFSYDETFTDVHQGYLDTETNILYEKNVPITTIKDDVIIKIVNNDAIYIIDI